MAGGTSLPERADDASRFARLIEIGIALSAERDHDRLLEEILLGAKDLANADGGTLYLRAGQETLTRHERRFVSDRRSEDLGCAEGDRRNGENRRINVDRLEFTIIRNDTLKIAKGGTTGEWASFPPLPLYDPETGEPNHHNVATHAALTGKSINIADAYEAEDFDFSGTRKFDAGTGYRSKSFLTVPLKSHGGEIIGVLQLINAKDAEGETIPFSMEIEPLIQALSSQAAVALDNQQLIEAQKKLLESFIEMIAGAIDAKSPYTGGHCQRVPELTLMLAKAACESSDEAFKDFDLTEEELYELHIAAWLHDCGKVTTPEYVVDKATKLETIYDRIHEIRTRFEILKRDAEIDYLKGLMNGKKSPEELTAAYEKEIAELDDDFAFIAGSNIGGEFMDEGKLERIKKIASRKWMRTLDDRLGLSQAELKRKSATPVKTLPAEEPLLSDKDEHIIDWGSSERVAGEEEGFRIDVPEHKFNKGEIYNLSVARGTLTKEERYKINDHIVQTIRMLSHLPFPKHMRRVPEYAGGPHETLIGGGYPRRLAKEQMSLPARMMAIADIFEALTACDRPYKKAKTLSEALKIMSFMKKDQHIDADLFRLFLESGIYREYAERCLLPSQIDEVDVSQYLG